MEPSAPAAGAKGRVWREMAASDHSDGVKRLGTAGAGLPPGISAEAVRAELEKVLKSPALVHSGRLCRFLAFVVDQTLNGHADQLKEIGRAHV